MSSTSRQSMSTESGEIILPPKAVRDLRKLLCDWTNQTHEAVLFEVQTLTADLPSTGVGLDALEQRLTEPPWSDDRGTPTRRLVRRLAAAAVVDHVRQCRSTTGRLRQPTARTLDELLPRRTGRDLYFRVPDEYGDVEAGLTLDFDAVSWHATDTPRRTAAAARRAPLAAIAFAFLARAKLRPGQGGEITDSDGIVVASYR